MRHILIAAAMLGLTACSPAPDKEATEAPAAATPNAQTPEAFVRSLYFGDDSQPDSGGDDQPEGNGRIEEMPIWSARTQALLAESDRLTPRGSMGFFEADPICECEEGTIVLQSVSTTSTGPDSADVAVVQSFSEPGDTRVNRKTYNLVREGGRWLIDDQHYESIGQFSQEPMVERLEAWIVGAKEPGAFQEN